MQMTVKWLKCILERDPNTKAKLLRLMTTSSQNRKQKIYVHLLSKIKTILILELLEGHFKLTAPRFDLPLTSKLYSMSSCTLYPQWSSWGLLLAGWPGCPGWGQWSQGPGPNWPDFCRSGFWPTQPLSPPRFPLCIKQKQFRAINTYMYSVCWLFTL